MREEATNNRKRGVHLCTPHIITLAFNFIYWVDLEVLTVILQWYDILRVDGMCLFS